MRGVGQQHSSHGSSSRWHLLQQGAEEEERNPVPSVACECRVGGLKGWALKTLPRRCVDVEHCPHGETSARGASLPGHCPEELGPYIRGTAVSVAEAS